MPTIVQNEGSLRFSFGARDVFKWDEHRAFMDGVRRLQKTKAVDFVVALLDDAIALVEVKDFRGYRRENRKRIRTGELAQEVAEKVRDSLSGLFWASRREHDQGEVARAAALVSRRETPRVKVVAWIEDDRLDAAAASALQAEIQRMVRTFLAAKVVVTSTRLETMSTAPLRWIEVVSLSSPRR
ncbi:MAG: hypothetical protein AB1730_24360 [Myxococcota bacterium]|jgi:hypothetical protein